jgi:hypothetical protein
MVEKKCFSCYLSHTPERAIETVVLYYDLYENEGECILVGEHLIVVFHRDQSKKTRSLLFYPGSAKVNGRNLRVD